MGCGFAISPVVGVMTQDESKIKGTLYIAFAFFFVVDKIFVICRAVVGYTLLVHFE